MPMRWSPDKYRKSQEVAESEQRIQQRAIPEEPRYTNINRRLIEEDRYSENCKGGFFMFGVIKDGNLVGLYHKYKCPQLYREQRVKGGNIKRLNRVVKMTNKFYCRWCIYIEAEGQGINCFDICPQKVCLKTERLPPEMLKEMVETVKLR
jgi:hypothetical protein